MKKFFFELIGRSVHPVAMMQRKSGNVFNIFNKTLKKLEGINADIAQHKQASLDAIAAHQSNHDQLSSQQEKNTRLIEKLNDFVA